MVLASQFFLTSNYSKNKNKLKYYKGAGKPKRKEDGGKIDKNISYFCSFVESRLKYIEMRQDG